MSVAASSGHSSVDQPGEPGEQEKSEEKSVLEQAKEIDSQILPTFAGQYIVTPTPESFSEPQYPNRNIVEFAGDEEDWDKFKAEFESLDVEIKETYGGNPRYDIRESSSESYNGIPVLQPEIGQISSFEELANLDEEMVEIFEENVEVGGWVEDAEQHVRALVDQLNPESAAQIFDLFLGTGLSSFTAGREEREKKKELVEVDLLFCRLNKTGQTRFADHVEDGDAGATVEEISSMLAEDPTDSTSGEINDLLEIESDDEYEEQLTRLVDGDISSQPSNETLIEAAETINEEIWAEIRNKHPDKIDEVTDYISSYDRLRPRFKSQILSKLVDDVADEDDAKKEKVQEFGEIVSRLNPDLRDELYNILKTDTDRAIENREINQHGRRAEYSEGDDKLGNTLFEIAVNRDYTLFTQGEARSIEELLKKEADLPDLDPESEESPYKEAFEPDSPYLEILEEVIEEFEDEIRSVRGLAEEVDEEYAPDFGLASKEGRRKNDPSFDPEEHEDFETLWEHLKKEARKDIDNKKRDYLKRGIQNLGFEAALREYEVATGEKPEELTKNELAALKVRARFDGRATGMVDKLLKHQNNVYELEANQEWLQDNNFNQEEIIGPDLTNQVDEEYRRPEEPEQDSELQVKVDQSDIQIDTEGEKQQYWEEITLLLNRVGIEDEFEDIEEVERAISELEEPENEQDYRELKDVVNNYRSVETRAGGIPDELTLRVADPMDTVRMGSGFGSCMDIEDGVNAWGAPAQSIDANKMVFYAENEHGRERARVKAFITDDEELIYHNTSQYKDIDLDVSEYFEDYMEKVARNLGLELKHSSEAENWEQRTPLLEADDWYSRA